MLDKLGSVCVAEFITLDPSQVGYRALLTVAKMGLKYAEVVRDFLDAGWSPDFSLEVSRALTVCVLL